MSEKRSLHAAAQRLLRIKDIGACDAQDFTDVVEACLDEHPADDLPGLWDESDRLVGLPCPSCGRVSYDEDDGYYWCEECRVGFHDVKDGE